MIITTKQFSKKYLYIMQHYCEDFCFMDILINNLWVSVVFLYNFESHCHSCPCVMVPVCVSQPLLYANGQQSLNDYFCLKAVQKVRERTRECKNKENPCQEPTFFGSRACVIFFVCLFSPWDFNVPFCRGSAEQFHLPAFIQPSWWEAFTKPW